MNKYTNLLIFIINRAGKSNVTEDTAIQDLFGDGFDEVSWLKCLFTFEVLISKDIPDAVAWPITGTIAEFCVKVKALPGIPENEYQEFVRIKTRLNQYMYDADIRSRDPDIELKMSAAEKEQMKREGEDVDREYWAFIGRVLGRKK